MRKGLVFLIAAAFLIALSGRAMAAEQVSVALYLLNIGDFNPSTGSFTADFYLDLRCTNTCPAMDHDFLNGWASYVNNITVDPNERLYRIHGRFSSAMDWSKAPFDRQVLSIILGDKRATNDTINYTSSMAESGVDPSVAVGGWKVTKFSASAEPHEFSVYGVKRPNYVFSVELSRDWLGSLLKLLLPVLVLMVIVISTFFTAIDKIPTRMGIVATALAALAIFHATAALQMPAPGFFTFNDIFMVLNYALLAAVFILNLALLSLLDRSMKERAVKINRIARMGMIAATAALYAVLFLFFA